MEPTRLQPVTLIAGAVSRFGAIAARELSARSQGGLLLADGDEQKLLTLADELEAERATPERLSTLAFDAADPSKWAKASGFVVEQYGRLDWAVIAAPKAAVSELVDFRPADRIDATALALALRAAGALMRNNSQGGAIVIGVDAHMLAAETERQQMAEILELAAANGRGSAVRVNLIILGGANIAPWAEAPDLPHLHQSSRGATRAAFEYLLQSDDKVARCSESVALPRLIGLLMADDLAISGATIAVDAEQAM